MTTRLQWLCELWPNWAETIEQAPIVHEHEFLSVVDILPLPGPDKAEAWLGVLDNYRIGLAFVG